MAVKHTVVPYMWRRHLGVVRALLALVGLIIYLVHPVPSGLLISLVIGVYAAYSVFELIRDSIESRTYQRSLLVVDVLFFFMIAMHPSQQGLWLATIIYFYLMCIAGLLYEWKDVAAIVGAIMAFLIAIRPMPAFILVPTILLAGVLSIVFTMQKMSLQERLSTALKRSLLSRSEAETARESERQRIGADFHDGPLQSFISFQMRLEIIRKLLTRDVDAAMREVVQLQELGKSQVVELRSFVRNMQPVELSHAGLHASIREILSVFERDSGINGTLVADDVQDIEDPELATEVLQIIREALNNVRKHSKASRVTVAIESIDHAIKITVEDDGSGFPFTGAYNLDELELLRLGPRSIKRRIRTLGGELVIESKPSQGAGLKMRIPL